MLGIHLREKYLKKRRFFLQPPSPKVISGEKMLPREINFFSVVFSYGSASILPAFYSIYPRRYCVIVQIRRLINIFNCGRDQHRLRERRYSGFLFSTRYDSIIRISLAYIPDLRFSLRGLSTSINPLLFVRECISRRERELRAWRTAFRN